MERMFQPDTFIRRIDSNKILGEKQGAQGEICVNERYFYFTIIDQKLQSSNFMYFPHVHAYYTIGRINEHINKFCIPNYLIRFVR